ncbi:MAG: hypothetical protein IPM51_11650 [Sphingobacteriaceae bacterium]|nr:hypothetical protein [Sphingobacteriaceae bacterium]
MFIKKVVKEYVYDQLNTKYNSEDKNLMQHRREIHNCHGRLQAAMQQGDLMNIGNSLAVLMFVCLKMYAYFYLDPIPFFKQVMGEDITNQQVIHQALKVRKNENEN